MAVKVISNCTIQYRVPEAENFHLGSPGCWIDLRTISPASCLSQIRKELNLAQDDNPDVSLRVFIEDWNNNESEYHYI